MPTTIKAALKKWEEASGKKSAEAKEIKLIGGLTKSSSVTFICVEPNFTVTLFGHCSSKAKVSSGNGSSSVKIIIPLLLASMLNQIPKSLGIEVIVSDSTGVYPPIEKLEGPLHILVNCEKLSLSTNLIVNIQNLQVQHKC